MGYKNRLICGVGVNDSSYTLHRFEMVGGVNKRVWICPFYQTWHSMLSRCYSEYFLARKPTYIGCSVAPEWQRFSRFKEWMEIQPWQGRALDKDIIAKGNKVYAPDFCAFVSKGLNNFVGDCGRARGKYLIGASWHKRTETFRADCNNPFTSKTESLGHFKCEGKAHLAWRQRKHQHALRYADMQDDPRVADALRIRYLNTGSSM